ncbi:MAG: glycosyltransferase family 4 protein, partial [Steroidobacteraceae bacterium]|nr:glycosyltransferase family 4 protein [Steroidobacteraceae bacterium]MDW8260196.1 glycosyltransferase [Gammaproteobacteria bacterium]
TLGFIGSFYAYEGLDLLLDAVPAIAAFAPQLRVLLVGGGLEEQRLKERAARLGIAERVIFAGRVPHAEVARYYSVIDLLVYPRKSIRLTETVTPLKPLEAMAQGRVLIASDVGGHRELIADRRTGYLFRADDARAVVECVERALRDRARWPDLGAAGRRYVEQERNWQHSTQRYRGVYDAVLARAR